MWPLNGIRIYLAREPVDLRKSIDGLSVLVSQVLGQDPFSAHLFVFTNRHRDKLKALSWDQNGFVLYYKRLEQGRFRWPVIPADQAVLVIDYRQLQWLLSGLSIEQRQALPAVAARVVA
ncbi:MAG TPA: IS66 family insertion sequence element accessory protein TnpB [Candidatus Competibacteraceae bacterium]|nr:IS66 family insertion sequence element accessory protein TnpB [Candidatus Competibacteraceae bacterium]